MTNAEGMTKSENRKSRGNDSFWRDGAESMVREEAETKRVYDLEERTARFGEAVIDFAKAIPQDAVTSRTIGKRTLDGSQRTASDLLQDLEKWKR